MKFRKREWFSYASQFKGHRTTLGAQQRCCFAESHQPSKRGASTPSARRWLSYFAFKKFHYTPQSCSYHFNDNILVELERWPCRAMTIYDLILSYHPSFWRYFSYSYSCISLFPMWVMKWLLFLVYINDLPYFTKNLCEIFADDTTLIF